MPLITTQYERLKTDFSEIIKKKLQTENLYKVIYRSMQKNNSDDVLKRCESHNDDGAAYMKEKGIGGQQRK